MTVSAVIFWDRVRKEDPFFVCHLANAGDYYYYYYFAIFEKNLNQKSVHSKVFDNSNYFPFKPISFLAISAFLLEP